MNPTLISVIIPTLNEEKNVYNAYTEILKQFQSDDSIDYEIIFTDNHSTDNTFENLKLISKSDPKVKVIRFSRNFGFNKSILTGYRISSGEAAIQIDCDLEDPPGIFKDFIFQWRQGYDVVVGIRDKRHESYLLSASRKIFYRFLDSISDSPHQVDAGDFRLIDRSIINQLIEINDVNPYVRGLISELAKKQIGIKYTRNKRVHGTSKFPIKQLIKLGFEGVYAHSTIPLKIATYIGIMVAFITICLICFYIGAKIFAANIWPAGFATTTIITLLGISINALLLGIIGEYLGRIYQQLRKRPTVIVEEMLNFSELAPTNSRKSDHGL